MAISQKCQYAVRALFELARQYGAGAVSISEIAEKQQVPRRFLGVIVGELRQGGFVESRRGARGGYRLSRRPAEVTVGEVIRFMQGPIAPVRCLTGGSERECPLEGCVFKNLWRRAQEAASGVYDNTTLGDLVAEEQAMRPSEDF